MSMHLEHKGYKGSVEEQDGGKGYYGKVIGVRDLVTYEGRTLRELEVEFKAAVDDWLKR